MTKAFRIERKLSEETADDDHDCAGELSGKRPGRCVADCSDHAETPGMQSRSIIFNGVQRLTLQSCLLAKKIHPEKTFEPEGDMGTRPMVNSVKLRIATARLSHSLDRAATTLSAVRAR